MYARARKMRTVQVCDRRVRVIVRELTRGYKVLRLLYSGRGM